MHSRYLQQLCSLALLLRLDSVLCTQPAPVHVAQPEPGMCGRKAICLLHHGFHLSFCLNIRSLFMLLPIFSFFVIEYCHFIFFVSLPCYISLISLPSVDFLSFFVMVLFPLSLPLSACLCATAEEEQAATANPHFLSCFVAVVEWSWLDTLCTAVATAESLRARTSLPSSFVARHFKYAGELCVCVLQ